MVLNENTVLIKNPQNSTRKYLKSTIIEPGITLNEAASSFFDHIDGNRTLSAICREMEAEYDADYETLLKDITELAESLVEQNVLIIKYNGNKSHEKTYNL